MKKLLACILAQETMATLLLTTVQCCCAISVPFTSILGKVLRHPTNYIAVCIQRPLVMTHLAQASHESEVKQGKSTSFIPHGAVSSYILTITDMNQYKDKPLLKPETDKNYYHND